MALGALFGAAVIAIRGMALPDGVLVGVTLLVAFTYGAIAIGLLSGSPPE